MNNLIIFDSDFVIANNNKIIDILKKLKNYNCYITEVSINEISSIRCIEKSEKIEEFIQEFNNYKELDFNFEENQKNLESVVKKQTENRLRKIFNNNVIKYHKYAVDLILERAYKKIPPFTKSDKGLKDTLIFLNIKDFLKEKNINKAYFVTNDSDFLSTKEQLIEEISSATNCEFDIISGKNSIEKLYNFFGVGNSEEIKKLSDKIDNDYNIKDLRKKLNNICWDLFYSENPDPYDFNNNYIENFAVMDYINKDDIKTFFKNLKKNIESSIFNSNVKISHFFENPFLFKNELNINIEIFEELNKIYQEIQSNPEYVNALANLLYDNFMLFYNTDEDEIKF